MPQLTADRRLLVHSPQLDGACTVCNVCSTPGTLAGADETANVACHVRAFQHDRFTVWRCTSCGSLHSADAVELSQYYNGYPVQQQQLDTCTRLGYQNRLRVLNRIGLAKSHSILDYGCNTGAFVRFLSECGFADVAGYDAYVTGYADRRALRREYDLVTSYDVIEHVEQPREFMRTCAGIVKPGGHLAIGTPNADWLSLDDPGEVPVDVSQPYHRHILSERALLALAAREGFVPVYTCRRVSADTWIPGVNTRFAWNYIKATGGLLDAIFEPIRPGVVLRTPSLWFDALFGYFFPLKTGITVIFRRTAEVL